MTNQNVTDFIDCPSKLNFNIEKLANIFFQPVCKMLTNHTHSCTWCLACFLNFFLYFSWHYSLLFWIAKKLITSKYYTTDQNPPKSSNIGFVSYVMLQLINRYYCLFKEENYRNLRFAQKLHSEYLTQICLRFFKIWGLKEELCLGSIITWNRMQFVEVSWKGL